MSTLQSYTEKEQKRKQPEPEANHVCWQIDSLERCFLQLGIRMHKS